MYYYNLEMKYLVLCVTLKFLFFANIVSSTVNIVPKYDVSTSNTTKYEIKEALKLVCNVSSEDLDENAKLLVKWEKDGQPVTEIESLRNRLSLSHNGGIHKLQINSGEENDAGNYSCIALVNNIEEKRAYLTVESKVHVKIPRDISVIEGNQLRVVCQVVGRPIPQLMWTYKSVQYKVSDGRIKIETDTEKDVPNAVFVVDDIVLEDQGELICRGYSRITNESSDPSIGTVRVKDKYAALWPFLGICAEVLVLCAIILIYEKKRNKAELEESDTDQSPEQKNTPDHGKESNLRHRQ